MFSAIAFSLSKMGFLSALGSLFVMAALLLGSTLRGAKRWVALGGVPVAVFLTLVLVPTAKLITGFGEAAFDPTGEGRWPIAKDTLHLIAAYPLLGSGMGTYFPAILRYETYGSNLAWTHAHNDYLQLLSELGIVGVLIPAVLIGSLF